MALFLGRDKITDGGEFGGQPGKGKIETNRAHDALSLGRGEKHGLGVNETTGPENRGHLASILADRRLAR